MARVRLPCRAPQRQREIARLGGGIVESSPEDVEGRKVSNSFLYNGTVAMFEQHGFQRGRQLGKNNWLVSTQVAAAAAATGGCDRLP